MNRSIILLIILYSTSFHTEAQSPDSILHRYYQQVSGGDIQNWGTIKTVVTISEGGYSQSGFDNVPNFTPQKSNITKRYEEWPDKSVLELYQDSVVFSRYYILHGKHIFIIGNMPPIDPSLPNAEDIGLGFPPMYIEHLRRGSKTVTWLGIKEFDTGDCHELQFKTKRQTHLVYINVDTSLLDYMATTSPTGNLMLTHFEDYQPVDRFLIAMKRTEMRDGSIYNWETFKDIKLNTPIDPKVFDYTQRR